MNGIVTLKRSKNRKGSGKEGKEREDQIRKGLERKWKKTIQENAQSRKLKIKERKK